MHMHESIIKNYETWKIFKLYGSYKSLKKALPLGADLLFKHLSLGHKVIDIIPPVLSFP